MFEANKIRICEQSALATLGLLCRRYAVKLHHASTLHFDLRLEWNGVLLSWAIPSDLTLQPSVEYDAVEMEDHNPANIRFEGLHHTGAIMLWDEGAWEPLPGFENVLDHLDRGELRFKLLQGRLKGIWRLFRTTRTSGGRPVWTLQLESSPSATVSVSLRALDKWPRSIYSKRTMQEIWNDWTEPKKREKPPGLFD